MSAVDCSSSASVHERMERESLVVLNLVAVDNTTGALYVCDYYNDRVVVYY